MDTNIITKPVLSEQECKCFIKEADNILRRVLSKNLAQFKKFEGVYLPFRTKMAELGKTNVLQKGEPGCDKLYLLIVELEVIYLSKRFKTYSNKEWLFEFFLPFLNKNLDPKFGKPDTFECEETKDTDFSINPKIIKARLTKFYGPDKAEGLWNMYSNMLKEIVVTKLVKQNGEAYLVVPVGAFKVNLSNGSLRNTFDWTIGQWSYWKNFKYVRLMLEEED